MIHDLEQDIEQIGVRLLDLVEEQHRVRLLGHRLGQQAALVEPLACTVHGIERSGITLGDRVCVIGDGPIDYPKATVVDACLAMTQESADKYANGIKEGGLLLLDEDFVQRTPEGNFKVLRLPIMRLAKEDIGREIVANVVALGAMIALTDAVSREAGEKAVLAKVPEAFKELNQKAFSLGFDKGKEAMN